MDFILKGVSEVSKWINSVGWFLKKSCEGKYCQAHPLTAKSPSPSLCTKNSARHSQKSIKTQIAPSIRAFIYTLQGYLCSALCRNAFSLSCILNQAELWKGNSAYQYKSSLAQAISVCALGLIPSSHTHTWPRPPKKSNISKHKQFD